MNVNELVGVNVLVSAIVYVGVEVTVGVSDHVGVGGGGVGVSVGNRVTGWVGVKVMV